MARWNQAATMAAAYLHDLDASTDDGSAKRCVLRTAALVQDGVGVEWVAGD